MLPRVNLWTGCRSLSALLNMVLSTFVVFQFGILFEILDGQLWVYHSSTTHAAAVILNAQPLHEMCHIEGDKHHKHLEECSRHKRYLSFSLRKKHVMNTPLYVCAYICMRMHSAGCVIAGKVAARRERRQEVQGLIAEHCHCVCHSIPVLLAETVSWVVKHMRKTAARTTDQSSK